MRTDSVRIADEALAAGREHIRSVYGEAALPAEPAATSRRRRADAHEAIRRRTLDLPPERVAAYLQPDELKLYRLNLEPLRRLADEAPLAVVTTVEIEGSAREVERLSRRASISTVVHPRSARASSASEKRLQIRR